MRLVLSSIVALLSLVSAAEDLVWRGAAPAVTLEAVDGGYVRLVAEEDGYLPDLAAIGAPGLPQKAVMFDIPAEAEVTAVTAEAVWETLAENVRVEPVAEPVRDGETPIAAEPDAAIYGGTDSWPTEAARRDPEGRRNGARILPVTVTPFRWNPASGILERAREIVVTVSLKETVKVAAATIRTSKTFRTSRTTLNVQSTALTLQSNNQTIKQSNNLSEEPGLYRTNPETNAFEYLLVSPPDFYDDWCWYVEQRQNTHTNLRFAVKNTAAIYAAYPFSATNACRNAAESIHAYLRSVAATSNGLQYVVLGGAWLDAQNLNGYTPYFATGEAMSLSNCVPGIYGFPREDWRQIPADLFYGCFDMNANQKYPWDNNGDGKYIDKNDCSSNDTYPDVCVSRITLNPHSGYGTAYNQHELITNYVAKLKRGEDRYFAGHYRYGMSVASTGSSKLRKTGDRMYYRELEFYDNMYNMFDPRHHDSLEDGEYSTRVRYYDQFSNWRPLRSVKGMMNYTWTEGLPNLSAAMDDYYAGDRDFGYVQAHGWAQGAAQFSAGRFATASGLTLFNGGSGPCETGYPDYHVSSGSRKVLQYNVGDAAVTNPKGGALASVNNSRWSWAGGGGGFAAMSYYMLNEMLIGFNGERLDVGHAWLKGVRNYWPAGRWGNTAGWVLSEQFLYGDPLVRLPEVPNNWWTGGETGVWDLATANWTNNVDAAKTFDAARNVYFDVQTNLALDVTGEIAAMRLSIPVWQEDAVVSFAGTGSLKVVQCVDLAGTNATLKFNVAGGVGHSGIQFLTGAGDLVFEGTNKFYVAGVKNAKAVALRGGGVTLDVDEFVDGDFPLIINGTMASCGTHDATLSGELGVTRPSVANELRSKNVGGLKRFGSLVITNSYVKLSTVDAFGNDAPMNHALVDSELEIAANVYYQRSGFPEGLNATFAVDGDSSVTSSEGGLWTVKHTTTFVLGAGAAAQPESAPDQATHLTLSAETVNAGGKIVITNAPSLDLLSPPTFSNTVTIANATALAGDVTIGADIRLVLKELPLSSVTSLTIGEGATIELPDEASGYWQIVPVSSKFTCADDVAFALSSDPTNRLVGSSSKTGSFFREGALYRWTGREGEWNTYFANRHPKVLFGDIDGVSVVTVRVAAALSPEFAFFANLKTKYVFEAASDDASVLFSSIYFCGPTEFNVPVGATEYVDISTSTTRFSSVTAPYVHVAAGAGLALAGSHWTDFRFDEGAVLVASPDDALDYNADTTFTFPDHGEVLIDTTILDLLSRPTFSSLITGHTWFLADLKQFQLVQTNAELRIDGDTLGVVWGENLKGPYELDFVGATNWNCTVWTVTNAAVGGATALPAPWAECALDWTADAVVTVNKLTLDCDVHLQTLTIHAGTNNFALAAVGGATALPTMEIVTLDLTDCHGTTDIGVDLGAATVLTEASTNGADVVHLRGTGSGTIELSGSTLILDQPGEWTLNKGAQGTLRVVAPQAYERFRIAKVPTGFENSGLTIEVVDASYNVISGFKTSVSDGALWCVPPALEAEVPPGTNDLTRLVWHDVLGNVVSNVDWTSSVAGFLLIGTPTSGVVIAKSGFSSVWSQLSVSNEVTIYGKETLSPSAIPGGNGVLALAGAFTIKADVNASPNLLSGAKLKLCEGSTLEIRHKTTNYDAHNQDWSGIVGTGRVVFADAVNTWIALPSKIFAKTLSVETASDIVLTEGYVGNAFGVRNLSGGGRFRADWTGGGTERPVRTVQTGVTAYSGYLHHNTDSRTATLVVSSDDATASTNKALVLNGTAVENHALTIETNGCVILTGTWKGPIKVSGILVITNAVATNGLSVTIASGGKVQTVAPEDLPPITVAPEYVAPTYPDDPTTPEVVGGDLRAPRILTANVAAEDVGGRGATALPWSGLDWRDTNGEVVVAIDWAAVTNVTITATNGVAGQQTDDNKEVRVLFDEEEFTGVVCLGRAASPLAAASAALTLEVRKTCPFTLAADSVGAIDFRLDPEPTATCDLLAIDDSSAVLSTLYSLLSNVTVTVHNRYGREIAAAGEVAFDATKGKYYLNVQSVNKPTYNCTFDLGYEDSITSPLWFSGSGNLTYKARPDLFEDSRDGRALKGTSMNGFAMHSHNGNPTVGMDNINGWSFNFVVKLPTNNGGIVFAWGNKDSGNGVAFVRVRENVAGVYAWENGGGVRLVASANVPFASTQFHSYAVTFDGSTLSLYADGALAQAAPLFGKYPSRGFYQWFKMYGQNGGLSNGQTTVIDDFRLYVGTCLTATSVAKIADDFPPWPERPSAELDVADLAWSNLYWSAEAAADDSLSLLAGPGSLLFDAPVVVSNALAVSGGAVPVKFVGDGEWNVAGGLAIASSVEIDASGLDGTNLASYAVANVPYSRWLIRGSFSGTVNVTALPAVPADYGVRVEQFASLGVRLVFTAPRFAFAKAVGISVGDDSFAGLSGTLGLHPTSPTNWHAYAAWTNETRTVGGLSVVGSDGGKVDSQFPYGVGASVARYFVHTSFDGDSDSYNGKTNGLTISGLKARFGTYRVLVYLATDTSGANFGPVTVAGRTYAGVVAGSESESATVADATATAWGKSKVTAATEGVNAVVSDVLDRDEVSVFAQRLKNGSVYARAQIAAVEIVKVGEIHEFTGSRYTADVEGDTPWADGNGARLANHGVWRNGEFSSIAITAKVDAATLTFDTAVTAETFRVVTATNQTLTLKRSAPMAIYEIDLSGSQGAVTIEDGLNFCGTEGAPCLLAANPQGTLDIVVDNVATNQRLMKLASGFDCNVKNFTATVRDTAGNAPDESWTVLPLDGWLVLQRLDVDKPWYSLTFEKALTTSVPGSTVVSLKGEGTAQYVESCGEHWALTGATPYSDQQMASVPASWTIHAVAEMPKESNGILFGYGKQGQRGVGLVTVDANTVAVAWWDSRGKFTVINAAVTNATCQYHAYALVSTGTRVALYVDGAFGGSADVAVNPATPVLQIGSTYGNLVSGFVKTTTGVLDDWRLYDGVLSAAAIKSLADDFAPWPAYCTAMLTEEGTRWEDLAWNGVAEADRPLLLGGYGGSLAVTNACTVTNVLYATGNALALRFAGDGVLRAEAGLKLLTGWTIDCSDLDATNLMRRADAASLYEHWLFKGAYAGDDPMVTGVPELTDRYAIATVIDAATGVRLVVTVRADYVADLTNTTAWASGAGPGLDVKSVSWANEASSTITLTQAVDAATLVFDTNVTARLLTVVSTNGQQLTLAAATDAVVSIAGCDFSEACGALVISNGCFEGASVDLGAGTLFTIADGVLDLGTARPAHPIALAGGKVRASITEAEEQTFGTVDLIPVPAGAAAEDYVVCSHAGIAFESKYVSVAEGRLKVDTSAMNFPAFTMPLRAVMVAGKAWAEQAWYDSAAPSNVVPAVYWGSAANVAVRVDIASNAEVTVASGVTNVVVAGCGTIVSQGRWPRFDGLTDAATWHGTVRIAGKANCTGDDLSNLGNASSTVEMDGVSGWFYGCSNNGNIGTEHPYTLKIGAGGFAMTDGSSSQTYTFAQLTGAGVLHVGKASDGPTMRLVARESAGFVGTLEVSGNAGVTLGTPTKNPGNGRIVVASGATANVTAGAHWSTVNGLEFASGTTLNIVTEDASSASVDAFVSNASSEGNSNPSDAIETIASTGLASRLTVTRGNLTLPTDAHLTFDGGTDERDVWYVEGGDIVPYEAWTDDLELDGAYAAKAIVVTEPTTLILTDTGSVTVEDALKVKASLTIDARGLDGTNLAMCAVAGAPATRWLVKGPVTGTVSVLPPTVPAAYEVTSEVLPAYGVRLIVTANRLARFGAISVNLYRDEALAASDATSGLHPVARSEWTNLLVAAGGSVTVSNVTFTLGNGVSAYKLNNAPPDAVYRQYMDDGDGRTSVLAISGIGYEKYRVIVHYSTDTKDSTFQPLVVNDVSYSAQPTGATSTRYTLVGVNAAWGNTGPDHQALAPAEGVNALVTDVLTGSSVTIKAIRPSGSSSRATIAAVQIVRVGVLNEEYIPTYTATVGGATDWQDGEGAGLTHTAAWANHPYGTITLIPTNAASVTFDTTVTASVLRVTSAADAPLALAATASDNAIAALDFSAAEGSVTLSNTLGATAITLGADTRVFGSRDGLAFNVANGQRLTLGSGLLLASGTDTMASGGLVRYLGEIDSAAYATYLPIAGRFGFEKAVITGDLQNPKGTTNVAARAIVVEDGDDVKISSQNTYNCVDFSIAVNGGFLTYLNKSVWIGYAASYTQTGGLVTFGTGSSCDTFVPGYTSGGTYTMNISGGTTDVSRMSVKFDQPASINVSGTGVFKAKGFTKNRDSGTWKVTLSGAGLLELGAGGWGAQSQPLALAGGTLKAVETCEVKVPTTLTQPSTIAAANEKKLTVSGKITGSGSAALAIGAPGATGEVVIASAATLGTVTIEPGTKVSLPLGAVSGNLSVGAGATLNLTHSGSYDAVTNYICSGTLTLSDGAVLLLNNAALPKYCTREDNVLLVNPEERSWINPVTGAAQNFVYRFTGKTSGDWQTDANWEKYGEFEWSALASGDALPMVEKGNYSATVIDGAGISNAANRVVTLSGTMEGWTPQLALFNGVTVTVTRLKKLQENPKWIWVDETSSLAFSTFDSQTYNGELALYVAASNGVKFAADLGNSGTTFKYSLKGAGSVSYGAALTKCAHQICRADIQLNGKGVGRSIRSKRLVALTGSGNVGFTWANAAIAADDPKGEISAGMLMTAISVTNAIGSCVITQRTDGVYLDYVDRDGSSHYVHEVDYSNDVRQVEIPLAWILQLTNGTDAVLSPDDLSAPKISAALESTSAPNGLKPWESYVLGLEPTNADDRVSAEITFTDGKIRVNAMGLDETKFRGGAKVRYVLESTDDLTKSFQTLRTSQESETFSDLSSGDDAHFYRVRVDIHW